MRGLKTQESKKFELFFEIVQKKAAELNCVFFLYAGDGNDFCTDKMEGEDLMGWLIPESDANRFESIWKADSDLDEWIDYYCWAFWEKPDNPVIHFKFYD